MRSQKEENIEVNFVDVENTVGPHKRVWICCCVLTTAMCTVVFASNINIKMHKV